MTERPMLFSGPMVRAILDGRKTQTRRIVKGAPVEMVRLIDRNDRPTGEFGFCSTHSRVIDKHVKSPYGIIGDALWVREMWSGPYRYAELKPREMGGPFWYWADGNPEGGDWTRPKPSIHMPRWASRITLAVTDVRVQRLQEISEADAQAEGIARNPHGDEDQWIHYPAGSSAAGWLDPRRSFQSLWESINGAGSWDANPWVYALTFRVKS